MGIRSESTMNSREHRGSLNRHYKEIPCGHISLSYELGSYPMKELSSAVTTSKLKIMASCDFLITGILYRS